jgi:hypothetical protein
LIFANRLVLLRVEMKCENASNTGNHVSWNSEAGRVNGRIIKVHSSDVNYKGQTHRASRDEPQYEIESDKADHITVHKGSALKKPSTR